MVSSAKVRQRSLRKQRSKPRTRRNRRSRRRGGTGKRVRLSPPPTRKVVPRIERKDRPHNSAARSPMYDHAKRRRERKTLLKSIRELGDTDSLRKTALRNTLKLNASKNKKKWDDWNEFSKRVSSATRSVANR